MAFHPLRHFRTHVAEAPSPRQLNQFSDACSALDPTFQELTRWIVIGFILRRSKVGAIELTAEDRAFFLGNFKRGMKMLEILAKSKL
jgi:hypothetical protein